MASPSPSIPTPSADNYWEVAELWREAFRRRLREMHGYHRDILSLLWYLFRSVVLSVSIVGPGLLFCFVVVAAFAMEDLTYVIHDLHAAIAAEPVRDPRMYQEAIHVVSLAWAASALGALGLMIVIYPWRPPTREAIEDFMTRWHVEHSDVLSKKRVARSDGHLSDRRLPQQPT